MLMILSDNIGYCCWIFSEVLGGDQIIFDVMSSSQDKILDTCNARGLHSRLPSRLNKNCIESNQQVYAYITPHYETQQMQVCI